REKTLLTYDFAAQSFSLDKRQSGAGRPSLAQLPGLDSTGGIPVHILMDRSSVEVFLYGGKYTVTSRIYPKPASIHCDVFVEGRDVTLQDFRVWELGG
ncbi:MAG: GH32 C-terminal domain-containing protein, partial [Treponema sp.]|nr:GH32 C-terminal domain-containing protein [Treponema sp.]